MRRALPSFLLLANAVACSGGQLDLPVPLSTPAFDLDVGSAIDQAVTAACPAADAVSCQGIALICQAESGAPCDPVDLPAQFPAEIDVDGTTTRAEDLLPAEVADAARPQVAIPVDLGQALADAGASDPEQVKSVSFDEVFITWEENSLSFDAPVLDVYVGPAANDVSDPEALIASGDFVKVGTVGKDIDPDTAGFEVGQLAETTGQVPLAFVAGGNDAFNERLRSLAFTMVLSAPEGQSLTLKAVDGDDSKVRKPDGAAAIKLEATLTYTIDVAGALAPLGL
jgi:hypothetical protein